MPTAAQKEKEEQPGERHQGENRLIQHALKNQSLTVRFAHPVTDGRNTGAAGTQTTLMTASFSACVR